MLKRCAADAFIGVDPYQRPVRMMIHEILVILLLELIGGRLADVIGRDADVNCDPLRNIVIVVIYWLFRGNELVVVRVYFNPHAPADFFLLAFSFLPLFIINHVVTRLSLCHPGEASSHRKGRTPGP